MEKLVEAVNKMTLQLQEKKKLSREPSKEFLAKVVCFRCGKPRHLSRTCNENNSNGMKSTASPASDPKSSTTSTNNDTLQALLSLLENKEKEEERRDQHAFLSLYNGPLFLLAGRHERRKPISTLPYQKHKKDTEKTDPTLAPVAEENPVINDYPMEEIEHDTIKDNTNSNEINNPPNEPITVAKPVYQEKDVQVEAPKGSDPETKYWVEDSSSYSFPIHNSSPEKADNNLLNEVGARTRGLSNCYPCTPLVYFINPSLEFGYKPILDILDSYYEKEAIKYNMGELPQNVREQFEEFLQQNRIRFAWSSQDLSPTEKNYSTTEKECLAVVWAIGYFRHYLHGTFFTIITNHMTLKYLLSLNEPRGRLARWIMTLSEYHFNVIYKSGKLHANADSLSRIIKISNPRI
ncbi:26142_t:CDS:2 [Gigaspora rosea]|nr:26142_t:CDS:2 [Gigaspora rosea]